MFKLDADHYNTSLGKQIKRYSDLRMKRISHNSWYIFSTLYRIDSWLIQLNEDEQKIILLHSSRNPCGVYDKLNYHVQCVLKTKKHNWILQRINSHNAYKIKCERMNIVDKILGKKTPHRILR